MRSRKLLKLLSMMLVLAMVIGTVPKAARAEEAGVLTATVDISAQAGGRFLMTPMYDVVVSSNLAEQYGFENDKEGIVSSLDVLVRAHQLVYGDNFTPDTVGQYLLGTWGSSGVEGVEPSYFFTKVFEKTDDWSFGLNGGFPIDPVSGWGYSIDQAPIENGDEVAFFAYQGPGMSDYYTSLTITNQDGQLTATVTGFPFLGAMWGAVESTPLAGMQICTVGADGNSIEISGAITNADGKASLSLEPGEYMLTAVDKASGRYSVMPVAKVSIEEVIPQNNAPILTGEATANAAREAGSEYALDLTAIFTDADNDALTYYAKVGTGEYQEVPGGSYSYTQSMAGTYTLTFKANDGTEDSPEYVVTLKVKSVGTDPTTVFSGNWFSNSPVNVPMIVIKGVTVTETAWNGNECEITLSSNTSKDATMIFEIYASAGGPPAQWQGPWQNLDIRVNGTKLSNPSSPSAPYNTTNTEVSLVDGKLNVDVSIKVSSTITKTFKLKVEDGHVHSYSDWVKADDNNHKKVCTSNDGDCLAPTIVEGHKWGAGVEEAVTENGVVISTKTTYTCTECNAKKVTENTDANIVAITVPAGANASLYLKNPNLYFNFTEYSPLAITDNANETTTYYFSANTKNGTWVYRVSMEEKLTKAGYVAWGTKNINITYSDSDISPSERVDYAVTAEENSTVAEDSVLLNINSKNFLAMEVNDTKTLKAYRAWELVENYMNCIVTPDFHYTILSGEMFVDLSDKESPSAGEGDWKTLTAVSEGTAIIEVTFDALQLSGGSYDGVYGASDPARTGLMIVQVGGEVADVDFGIISRSSQGSVTYSASNDKDWDAEFDTLYFTGESGEIQLAPSVSGGTITKVEVSGDKGATWSELFANEGVYTAPIVSGNNIIKVTADTGVSYQVIRGDKIEVKFIEVTDAATNPADGDGIIEAGETIRVKLEGLHQPLPKISGNYNPGYTEKVRVTYQYNNERVRSSRGVQYTFITEGNYFDIVIPAENTQPTYTLTEGYIGLGMYGLPNISGKNADTHRNIPDEGCATRNTDSDGNAKETYHTRSMLPDLTIQVGNIAAPNTAPNVKGSAPATAAIELGKNYQINPETLFEDADGNNLTYTVSINGDTPVEADAAFIFTPSAQGTYTIKFTANDGKETAEHTITLTVTEAALEEPSGPVFNLPSDQIAGYVNISFEDNAIRKEGETGLRYPIALGAIIPVTSVPFKEGDTIADATLRLLDALGIGYSTNYGQYGFYLASIKNFEVNNTRYDEMGEFDAGNGSGWMITFNGVFINRSAGAFTVKDGDRVEWKFTCQLGSDIGDSFLEEDEEEKEESTTTKDETTGEVTTTTKTEVTVEGSTATATITKENVEETIKQAVENKAGEIVLTVTTEEEQDVETIKVQLDTQTVKDIVKDTTAALTVQTDKGTVTLDQETLQTVADQAAGGSVTLEIKEAEKLTKAQKKAAGENGHFIQLVIQSGEKTISKFQGGKATVTVKIPEKLAGKKVAAVHISDNGTMEKLNGEEVPIDGQKHYRFHTPHFSTFALVDTDEVDVYDLTVKEVTKLLKKLTPTVTSTKTSAKNVKVKGNFDAEEKEILQQIEDAGYTVKYNFFRSTNKYEGYKTRKVKDTLTYAQKNGEKGTYYYYKVRVEVYDADGNRVAVTKLNQCKNHKVKWTKK